jgi:hypothetical protein
MHPVKRNRQKEDEEIEADDWLQNTRLCPRDTYIKSASGVPNDKKPTG